MRIRFKKIFYPIVTQINMFFRWSVVLIRSAIYALLIIEVINGFFANLHTYMH